MDFEKSKNQFISIFSISLIQFLTPNIQNKLFSYYIFIKYRKKICVKYARKWIFTDLYLPYTGKDHCIKSVHIRSYSGPHFPAFGLKVLSIFPYSVQMWENTDQNNSEYGHFLRGARVREHCYSGIFYAVFHQVNSY